MEKIVLKNNHKYICENRAVVTVNLYSNSLLYKFNCIKVTHEDHNVANAGMLEVWDKNGNAIHCDCGWSIKEEA